VATLLEETIRDLPAFLDAGQRAEAREVADRDELEGWLEQFSDWTSRALLVAGGIDDLWFEVPVAMRKQLLDLIPQFFESGTIGMRAVARLIDSLDSETLIPLRQNVVFYFGAAMALMQKVYALVDEENIRLGALKSEEYQLRADADYEQGKREAALGKVTYFTVDEFKKRFA
jgi:hypothetical protein